MHAPEPTHPPEPQFAEHLFQYDAALAADAAPGPTILDEEGREVFSCLEILERFRPGDVELDAPGGAADTPQQPSLSETPTKAYASRTHDTIRVSARLGRFEIIKILGQGGCGVVFLAKDPVLHRAVALKIPRPEALLTPEVRQRFLREGRAAGCLDHPNLLPVFEAGEIGAICYLASAYCRGFTLKDWLRQYRRPVSAREAAALVATLADAMHYAHQKGICHRDLKPSNILLQIADCRLQIENQEVGSEEQSAICNLQSAIPKIIDFGLAKVFHETSGETLTRTGAVFGTPQYMAPEQAEGKTEAIGPATDVHALGVILYELLTGAIPYQADSDLETLRQVIAVEPRSPGRLCSRLPRDLETICLKCLEKEPGNRYGSMGELADDLRRFLDGHPIHARPIGRAARMLKWLRRRPHAAAVAGVTSLLLTALVAISIWISIRESAHSADMRRYEAQAEERDWVACNQHYAAQIRAGGLLKAQGRLAALRDVLLTQKPAAGQKDVRDFAWHYRWHSGQGFMLPGRKSTLTAIAYSQSGSICAAGNFDSGIELFDRPTGKLLTRLQGHAFEILTLDFFKDDTRLLSTAFSRTPDQKGFRGEFLLWDLAERKVLRRGAYAHKSEDLGHPIFAVASAARTLFIIDRDSTGHRLLMLDLDQGTQQELLRKENLFLVATTPTADRIAVVYYKLPPASGTCFVEILEPATKRRIAAAQFDRPVHMAAFSPDGKTLALGVGMGDSPYFVELRDVRSLRLRTSLAFAVLPYRLRYDGPGKRLAVTAGQNHFQIFDVQTSASLGSFTQKGASFLAFSPDGEELALGDVDGRVRTGKNVFDSQARSLPGPVPASEAWCLAFSHDGNTLVAGYDHERGSKPQTLRLWDLKSRTARTVAGHHATVMALAVSPDGKTFATASHDRSVRLWDMASGECRKKLTGHTGPVRALAYSPDGLQIASGGSDLSIKIWNVKAGSLQNSWRGHDDMIRSLTFSRDGERLISAANDRTIKIWNAKDQTLVRTIADEAHVQSVACSPDGRLLASGNETNTVEIWELASGTLVKTLPGHLGRVRSVAFSPDGKTLASGGEGKTVRLWNVLTGQELLVLPTEHFINGLAFDPRSKTLAAALHDGSVKIWAAE